MAQPTIIPIGSQLPPAVHYPHHLYLSNAPYLPIWLLFLDWLDPEDERIKILCKISNYSPSDTASHPRDFNLQQQCCENLISCIKITLISHTLYKQFSPFYFLSQILYQLNQSHLHCKSGIQLSSCGPTAAPLSRNLPTEYEGQRLINATSSTLISSSTKHYTYGTGY